MGLNMHQASPTHQRPKEAGGGGGGGASSPCFESPAPHQSSSQGHPHYTYRSSPEELLCPLQRPQHSSSDTCNELFHGRRSPRPSMSRFDACSVVIAPVMAASLVSASTKTSSCGGEGWVECHCSSSSRGHHRDSLRPPAHPLSSCSHARPALCLSGSYVSHKYLSAGSANEKNQLHNYTSKTLVVWTD